MPHSAFKGADKVVGVRKPAAGGNLGNRKVCGNQQFLGSRYPVEHQILLRTIAGVLLERMREIVKVNIKLVSDLRDFQILCVIVLNILLNLTDFRADCAPCGGKKSFFSSVQPDQQSF